MIQENGYWLVWGVQRIIQKQGVDFPEMEKKWFGGPEHLNQLLDKHGLYCTRAEEHMGLDVF